jgi:hypothetical protein
MIFKSLNTLAELLVYLCGLLRGSNADDSIAKHESEKSK